MESISSFTNIEFVLLLSFEMVPGNEGEDGVWVRGCVAGWMVAAPTSFSYLMPLTSQRPTYSDTIPVLGFNCPYFTPASHQPWKWQNFLVKWQKWDQIDRLPFLFFCSRVCTRWHPAVVFPTSSHFFLPFLLQPSQDGSRFTTQTWLKESESELSSSFQQSSHASQPDRQNGGICRHPRIRTARKCP